MKPTELVKCFACGNESERSSWAKIEASSSDGYTSLQYNMYNKSLGRWIGGPAKIIACPTCKTIRME